MQAEERAHRLFVETYDEHPVLIVRAPGRINLIGDHTDYNDGLVLPMAIDADLVVAARPRADRRVHAVSETRADHADFSLDTLTRESGWAEYLKGVAAELASDGLTGWDGAVASDVADGAGLSSSAAIELAAARVFAETSGLDWDPTAMALVGQRAENHWVGMNSGIMDQLICATARAGHARLIDCRDLTGTHVPVIPGTSVVLLDTGTRRRLVDSAYNLRRAECQEAAKSLGVDRLRDLTPGDLEPAALRTDLLGRARHVVTENRRTEAAAAALVAKDAATLGRLMNESHTSLRDDFDVSSPALDAMARAAQTAPGCFGARQTGGGFAGSCVALVDTGTVTQFIEQTMSAYSDKTGLTGNATICRAVDGVGSQWYE